MTFVPIPDGIRVVHVGTIGNVTIINTLGASNGDGSTGSSLQSIAQTHGDAWRSKILALLSNQYVHRQTYAYSLEDQSAAVGEATFSGTANGTSPGAPAPLNVCMVVALKTAKRGRTYSGRIFLSGGISTNVLDGGISWSPAYVAAVKTQFDAYKGAVDPALGHNGRMAICSKGSPSKGIAPTQTPVTTILPRPLIGTQRRRLS